MNFKLFFKSTFRQPLRTILLFLVIGLSAFMTVSRGSEYFAIKQETERLSCYYRPIGVLSRLDPDYDLYAAYDYLESDPRVKYVDWMRVTSGVMPDICNTVSDGMISKALNDSKSAQDPNSGFYGTDSFFYGTLNSAKKIGEEFMLDFTVDSVLAGYTEYVEPGMQRFITAPSEFSSEFDGLSIGERYFVRTRFSYLDNPDERVLIDRDYSNINLSLVRMSKDNPWLIHAPEDIDFSSTEYADLSRDIGVIHDNQHSVSIQATMDMSALPDMQESMRMFYMDDGRMLDYTDHAEGRKVCVIDAQLAVVRGLKVGDTLKIKLRNLNWPSFYYGWLHDTVDIENYGNYAEELIEFEIVGIFRTTVEDAIEYYNTVFIPLSIIPENFEPEISYDYHKYITYILNSQNDTDAFMNAAARKLKSFGLAPELIETNYMSFHAVSSPMIKSSFLNALLYSGLSVLALAIAVFIYVRSRKKDMAIARAMGASRAKCAANSMLPLVTIGLFSTLIGGALAWIYTANSIQNTLTKFLKLGIDTVNTELGIILPLCITGVVFAAVIIAAVIGVSIAVKGSPLWLIQGGGHKSTKARKRGLDKDNTKSKHKSRIFAVISILLTLIFAAGFVVLNFAIRSDYALLSRIQDRPVELELVNTGIQYVYDEDPDDGFVSRGTIDSIMNTGHFQSNYIEYKLVEMISTLSETYESQTTGNELKGEEFPLLYLNDMDKFLENNDRSIQITYNDAEGDDWFSQDWNHVTGLTPVVVPRSIYDKYRVRMTITFTLPHADGSVSSWHHDVLINGVYDGATVDGETPILIPMSAFINMIDDKNWIPYYPPVYFSAAEFALDPAAVNDSDAVLREVEDIVSEEMAEIEVVLHENNPDLVKNRLNVFKVLQVVALAAAVVFAALFIYSVVARKKTQKGETTGEK